MVTFDTKSYSKKLLHLISWSHWFTFFNIIAAIALSSYYLFSETAPDTILGQIYLITTWVSHIAFLTFMSFVLILFPLTIVWPNTRVIRTSGAIIFTFGLLLLILDGFIYSRLGYHLNASSRSQIIELIKEIAQANGVFYFISGLLAIVILGFEFTVSNYAWKHLKQLQKTIFARFVIFTIVLAFFFSHLTHIWADANLDYDVLRQDTVLPLSYPATAKTLLTKYGLFDIDDYIERTTSPLSFSRAIPNYPKLTPQQCLTTTPINQSVFLILTDEQLNEQQLQQLKRRISVSSYQLNNHVDTTLPNDTWFNLFYSLPNIYQQDILAQQTKPLLFQAIEQQNLASSYTLVSKDGNNSDSESLWFNELFDEKIELNDISSLVFANKLNNKKPGLHLIYFKSKASQSEKGLNPKQDGEQNSDSRYQFELFVDALLLAQQQKSNKDIIWISSLGNQHKDTRLAVKSALLIAPNKHNSSNITISQLTSHMDLQPTLMANWLGCHIDSKSYSNGVNLLTLNKDRVIANTSGEGLMIFNKDKSVFIDQNGNFESYSSQLAAPITVNKDFPLMIDGVHFIKQFSQQAEQLK
jgi:membrane-anchored protein YejM (alkaline phosphatase superfamily)